MESKFYQVTEFKLGLPAKGRLVCLDLGMKRIGVAVTDTLRIISTPYEILERKNIKKDINKVISILDEFNAVGLVVGYPLKLDNTPSNLCEIVESFVKKILQMKQLPVLLQDERMSSISASRVLSEYGISAQKRVKMEDKIAASFILQSVIDTI